MLIQQAWKQKRASDKEKKGRPGGDRDVFIPQVSAKSLKGKKGSSKFSPSSSISDANKPPSRNTGCMGGDNNGPSQILRNLWLGNREDSMNIKLLRQLGIKYILNATAQLDNCFEGQLMYLKINVKDKEGVELTPYYEKCIDFIDRGMKEGGVLVHCIAGERQRSVSTANPDSISNSIETLSFLTHCARCRSESLRFFHPRLPHEQQGGATLPSGRV